MRVLLIEDNDLLQEAMRRLIERLLPAARIDVVDNAPEAIQQLDTIAYDYILSDYSLRIGTGGDVLRHVRASFKFYVERNRFILLTGLIDEAVHLQHPLTFEKPLRFSKLAELLTAAPPP
jgi:CheY-like chemotaxis protein